VGSAVQRAVGGEVDVRPPRSPVLTKRWRAARIATLNSTLLRSCAFCGRYATRS